MNTTVMTLDVTPEPWCLCTCCVRKGRSPMMVRPEQLWVYPSSVQHVLRISRRVARPGGHALQAVDHSRSSFVAERTTDSPSLARGSSVISSPLQP